MNNRQQIKEKLIAYSKQIGIDAIGFATREGLLNRPSDYRTYLNLDYSCGFEEQDEQKRVDIAQCLPNAKTVIAIAMAYPNESLPRDLYDEESGYFCRASWGLDYHSVLQKRLQKLAQYCQDLIPELQYRIMVDTGSLSDRGAAVCCGLGWIGKNSNLINSDYGSFVYLGELIIDYELPEDQPLMGDPCRECQRCVKACPLGAINEDYRFIDTRKCLAYRTLDKQYPEPIVAEAIGRQGYIYGCDICQLVCPYNQKHINHYHDEFKGQKHEIQVNLLSLINMSNREFKAQFGHLSGSWRGKRVLQRNALFILGYRKRSALAPLYQSIIDQPDQSADLVQAAKWALKKLND